MSKQTTLTDILEAVSDLSTHMDGQFVQFKEEMKQEIRQEIAQSEHQLKAYIGSIALALPKILLF